MQYMILHSFPAVPVLRVENVTVMESDGTAVVTFTRSGDISSGSRFIVEVVPGTATTRKLLS